MSPEQQIELYLLHVLHDDTPKGYEFCYFFPFSYLMRATSMDREIVRGFCRSMRNRGFLQYGVGFNEDGETAGGGYTMTPAGATHYRNLQEILRADQIEKRDMITGKYAEDAKASWGSTSYG